MFEYVLIGWILTFMCLGFFQFGVASQAGEKKDKSKADDAELWGSLSFAAMVFGLTIWFFSY